MGLLAHQPGADVALSFIYFVGGLGLLCLLLPGVILAWSRFWAELGGTQPIEGHFFWSKGWVRLCGLLAIGLAGLLLHLRSPISLREPSPPPPQPPVAVPREEKDVLGVE